MRWEHEMRPKEMQVMISHDWAEMLDVTSWDEMFDLTYWHCWAEMFDVTSWEPIQSDYIQVNLDGSSHIECHIKVKWINLKFSTFSISWIKIIIKSMIEQKWFDIFFNYFNRKSRFISVNRRISNFSITLKVEFVDLSNKNS